MKSVTPDKNAQFPLADLIRQSVYRRLTGHEDVNDAERLSHDHLVAESAAAADPDGWPARETRAVLIDCC